MLLPCDKRNNTKRRGKEGQIINTTDIIMHKQMMIYNSKGRDIIRKL